MRKEKDSRRLKKSDELTRFGASIPARLLEEYDKLLTEMGYSNRSEGLRDLIRDRLAEEEWSKGGETVFGTITLIYEHATGDVTGHLMDITHEYHHRIISSMHVHMDHHHCMEVLLVKGSADDVRHLAGAVIGLRGVLHGKLTLATTGSRLGNLSNTDISHT